MFVQKPGDISTCHLCIIPICLGASLILSIEDSGQTLSFDPVKQADGRSVFADLGNRSHISCCWSPKVIKGFVRVTSWWVLEPRHQPMASNSLCFCAQQKLGAKGFNMYIFYGGCVSNWPLQQLICFSKLEATSEKLFCLSTFFLTNDFHKHILCSKTFKLFSFP